MYNMVPDPMEIGYWGKCRGNHENAEEEEFIPSEEEGANLRKLPTVSVKYEWEEPREQRGEKETQ